MTPVKAKNCDFQEEGVCAMDNRRKWHFDKSVNVPTVLAIITMLIGAFGYIMQQDQRQTRTEGRIDNLDRDHARTRAEVKELREDLKGSMERVENKLDKLADRLNRR